MDAEPPEVLIVAGPNGAGKTTFALKYLAGSDFRYPFINADVIAAEICPEDPQKVAVEAGRRMLAEVERRVASREDFVIETTLSGRTWARRIRDWQGDGYRVTLIYIRLASAEQSQKRVAQRVRKGGHHIPEADILRRFEKGLRNFHEIYKPIVNVWALYDNSGETPILLDQSEP